MNKQTLIKIDPEFLDTVKYYLPDREEMKEKVARILKYLSNLEDGVVSESRNCFRFKFDLMSIVLKYQILADYEYQEYGSPYCFDSCAINCGLKISELIDKEMTWVEDYEEQTYLQTSEEDLPF